MTDNHDRPPVPEEPAPFPGQQFSAAVLPTSDYRPAGEGPPPENRPVDPQAMPGGPGYAAQFPANQPTPVSGPPSDPFATQQPHVPGPPSNPFAAQPPPAQGPPSGSFPAQPAPEHGSPSDPFAAQTVATQGPSSDPFAAQPASAQGPPSGPFAAQPPTVLGPPSDPFAAQPHPVPGPAPKPRNRLTTVLSVLAIVFFLGTGAFAALWLIEQGDHKGTTSELDTVRANLTKTADELKSAQQARSQADTEKQRAQRDMENLKPCLDSAKRFVRAFTEAEAEKQYDEMIMNC